MSHWQQLPTPKFSPLEVEACKWLEEIQAVGWMIDLADKSVRVIPEKYKTNRFDSLVTFAGHLGWEIPEFMCPHCGALFTLRMMKDYSNQGRDTKLVPTHDYPKPCRAVCPGSQQTPRNPQSDKRPLWKDEKRSEL